MFDKTDLIHPELADDLYLIIHCQMTIFTNPNLTLYQTTKS